MDGSSNQALAAQYYWWKAKMGIDIEVYAEKRENEKWVLKTYNISKMIWLGVLTKPDQ